MSSKTIIMSSALLLLILTFQVGAETGSGPSPPNAYHYANFSPSMAVIIAVLISAFFLMGFFSIYLRHCFETSSSITVRNLGASLRRRAVTRGLDRSILEAFPTFRYSEVKDKKIGNGTLECAVCLNEFVEEDTLRLIPKCDHVFHPDCIDTWLESHVTCPVCRSNLAERTETTEPTYPPREVSVRITEEPDQPIIAPPHQIVRTQSTYHSMRGKIWPKYSRSHSTGHSLVQPGDYVDRFTLRLPEELRKQVMTHALNRTTSCMVGFQWIVARGLGPTGIGRSLKQVDPNVKPHRWVFLITPPFFSQAPSMWSPKVDGDVADGEGSTSAKTLRGVMKLPSFKCLEPKGEQTSF